MKKFSEVVAEIVAESAKLKDKYTDEKDVVVGFGCIFCQSEEEYKEFTEQIECLGKVVENTQSGFTYLLDTAIKTKAGDLRLVKIRKPDEKFKQRGDADFNTDFKKFKQKYLNNPKFELIKRPAFEMLRLADPEFKVLACFSNELKSKTLGIEI
jgi:hypothetical protein